MAGQPVLVPSPSSPDFSTASRLSQLEQRMTALERQSDITITAVRIGSYSGDPTSQVFSYAGGRLWVFYGGFGTAQINNGSYILTLRINGVSVTEEARQSMPPGGSASGMIIGMGMATEDVTNNAGLVLGDNTLTAVAQGGGPVMDPIRLNGLLIEWPYK
jgi:hypothetical protein